MSVLCEEKLAESAHDAQIKRNVAKHSVTRAWSKIPLDENGNIAADISPEKFGRLAPWCQSRWKARRALLVEKANKIKALKTPEIRSLAIQKEESLLSRDGTHIDRD
jgi:hypothetical protein